MTLYEYKMLSEDDRYERRRKPTRGIAENEEVTEMYLLFLSLINWN
jgi:hypothetical protein